MGGGYRITSPSWITSPPPTLEVRTRAKISDELVHSRVIPLDLTADFLPSSQKMTMEGPEVRTWWSAATGRDPGHWKHADLAV